MGLFKTSLFAGLSVCARLLSALAINKLLALQLGPAGYVLVGQFQNLLTILGGLCGGFASNAVTTLSAGNGREALRLWAPALWLLLGSWVLVCLLLGPWLGWLIGAGVGVQSVMLLGLPMVAAQGLVLAWLNGVQRMRAYFGLSIGASLVTLCSVAVLTLCFGVSGAMAGFVLGPTLSCVLALWWLWRAGLGGRVVVWPPPWSGLRELVSVGAMGLVAMLVVPCAQVLLRGHIVGALGPVAGGYWQSVTKLSDVYLMLITTTLSVYFLPRLAGLGSGAELRREVARVMGLVVAASGLMALSLYLARDMVLSVLFSRDFLGASQLVGWQVVGDVVKMVSWVFGFVLVGRGMVRAFVLTELGYGVVYLGSSMLLIERFGLVGAQMGYLAAGVVYALSVWWAYRREVSLMGR